MSFFNHFLGANGNATNESLETLKQRISSCQNSKDRGLNSLNFWFGANASNEKRLDVAIIGATGAGKSTTLNSLLFRKKAEVGTGVDPKTSEIQKYCYSKNISIWDTPGLGDSVEKDQVYAHKIKKLINKKHRCFKGDRLIDLCLIVVDASSRDLGTVYDIFKNVIKNNIEPERVQVIINQADCAMKSIDKDFNKKTRKPGKELLKFLEQKAISIQERIYESTNIRISKPIYYSAKYRYNIGKILNLIKNFNK